MTHEEGDDVTYIPLLSEPGDSTGDYPPGFIVPDTFAWALEGEDIGDVYPEFMSQWLPGLTAQKETEPDPPWWQFAPVDASQYFMHSYLN